MDNTIRFDLYASRERDAVLEAAKLLGLSVRFENDSNGPFAVTVPDPQTSYRFGQVSMSCLALRIAPR